MKEIYHDRLNNNQAEVTEIVEDRPKGDETAIIGGRIQQVKNI